MSILIQPTVQQVTVNQTTNAVTVKQTPNNVTIAAAFGGPVSPLVLTAHTATEIPLTLNGATGQTADLLDVNGVSTFALTPTAVANISTLTVNNNPNPSADASNNDYACITCNSVPQSNFHIRNVRGINVSIFGFNAAKVDNTYGGQFSSGISATNVTSGTLQGDNIWGVYASSGFNGSGTVTNIYGLEAVASAAGSAGSTVVNLYSVYAFLGLTGNTTVTNAYGFFLAAPTGNPANATNRYGLYVGFQGAGGHAITTADVSGNVLFNVDTLGQAQAVGFASTTVNKTAAYTLTTGDSFVTADATSAAFAMTLPAANSTIAGREYIVKKIDSSVNAVTLTAAGTDKIDGAAIYALSTQYKYVKVKSDGSSKWWVVANN